MTQLDGVGARRWFPRARTVLSGALAVLVLLLSGALTAGPRPLPAPGLRLASTTDPAPPTNVVATGVDRALNISWTAPAESFISGYQVYLDNNPSPVATPTGTSTTVTGLVNGRAYSVTVVTVTNFIATYQGTTRSTPVLGTPKDSVAPAAPTGVAAVRGDGQVTLSWTRNSADYDADGYRVMRGGVALTGLLTGVTTSSYVDTTVTNDVTYGYAVQTHDTSGNWSASSTPVASATPTDLTAPAAPTGLVATRGDGQVSLSWAANAESDLATYRVLRDGVEIATVTGRSYVDGGRTNDTSYAYSLVAVDTHGNRSPASSPAVSATPTDLTAPAAPTGLTASRGDGQVGLSWTASPETDLATYRLLRDGIEFATVVGTSYVDSGRTNDVTYTYSMVAVDTHGNRSPVSSPAVSATPTDLTAPATPTGFVGGRGDGRAGLAWNANAEADLASYRVIRDGVEIATVTATSYMDLGLTNDTTYRYTLVAVDTHGNRSAPTAAVLVTPTDLTPPGAPTGVVATRGDGRVTLTWNANTEPDLADYRVVRNLVEIATVTGTTGYLDLGVVNDTDYTYTVVAVDTHGNRSVSSAQATATPTDLGAPATPAGLVATRGDGQVGLAWTANGESDLATYRVLRDGGEIATVTGTSYLDGALTNDTAYSYALVAVDTHGNRSAASAPVAATPTDLTPPAAPAGLSATPGDRQVALSWVANGEPDLATYRVLRDGIEIATVTGTTYGDTGLTNGTTYTYRLMAVDTHGNRSAASGSATATPADTTPPAAPAALSATRGDGQVTLSWTASPEPDLATYRVLRDGVEIATLITTTFLDTGLTNDTTYGYQLVAVDTAGNRSAPSATLPSTPTDLTPPAAPTGLSVTRAPGQVTLTWAANTEPDLATYRVLRGGVEIATVTGATGYTDPGRVDGTAYTYAVVAVDTHGNRSPSSTPTTATPVDFTPPAVPAGLTATRGDGQVALSWTANTEPDLATYRVLRDGVEIATVTATTYVDTGRTNDTTYGYQLVAVDTTGNRSAASTTVSATPTDLTPPAAPTGLVGTRGSGKITLSWTANTEPDLATYRVLRDGVEVATVTGATSYTDNGRPNGTAYTYAIVAVDTHGNRSSSSAPSTVSPTDTTPPAVPAGLTATAGDKQVTLTWTANTEPDLASYRLLRDGVEIATLSGTTTYLDTGLTNGTTYSYALAAVDTVGNRSASSSPVSATPADAPPAPPTGVTATPGDRRAVVSWTAPPDTDVVSYRVLAQDLTTVLATATAPTVQAAVNGLTNGTAYRFAVVAVDAGGHASAPSALSAPVTPVSPAVPTGGAGESGGLAVSADGRYVVVGTRGSLEASDTNTAYELYLLDRTAGTARRIAPMAGTATGATDPTNTAAPAISADGSSVVLTTTAALAPGDTNGLADVYRYDTAARTWSLVSVPAAGTVNGSTAGAVLQTGSSVYATSPPVAMSADGDLVLFYSARSDLVAGDTNGFVDLFAKRISTGVVTRVSTTTAGGNLTGAATGPALALTPDGRFAVFPAATASGTVLLYRKTLSGAGAGDLAVVSSVTVAGRATQFPVYRDAGDIDVSDDGRYVALVTAAQITTATPGTLGSTGLAYRVDTTTGTALALGNGQSTVWEHQVELDPTGRYGFFATSSAELAADTNGHTDFYRRDLSGGVAGPLVLVTTDASGGSATGPIGAITPAEYGHLVALTGDRVVVSTSLGLVSADTNKLRDLYEKDLVTGLVRSPLG